MVGSTSRRRFMKTAGAALAGAALPMPAIGQGRPQLVVGVYGGLIEQTIRDNFLPEFEKAHGATVKLEIGNGTTWLTKLIASRQAVFDVVSLTEDEASFGQAAGLWMDDQSAKLTNTPDLLKAATLAESGLYTSNFYDFPLVYDPAKLPNPDSWEDLWTPGLSVGVPDIVNPYTYFLLIAAAKLNGGGIDKLEPGFAKLKQLPDMKIYKGVTQGFSMFSQGEINAGMFYRHRTLQLQEQGFDYRYVVPKEGAYSLRAGSQIVAGSRQPELATAWVDMTLGLAYQTKFGELLYTPANRKVELSADLTEKIVLDEAAASSRNYAPWRQLQEQRDALLNRWAREFAG